MKHFDYQSEPNSESDLTSDSCSYAEPELLQERVEELARECNALRRERDSLLIVSDAFASSFNGLLLTDLEWKIQVANPSFLEMFEFASPDSVLDKRIGELFDSKSAKKLKEICEKISYDEGPNTYEYVLKRKDNVAIHLEVASTKYADESGKVHGRQLSFVDITRRKEAQDGRERYAKGLEDANEMLQAVDLQNRDSIANRDQFLAILSHELRNPLAGIQNAVRVLNHDDANPKQFQRAKRAIANQTRLMSRLMNDLLDVSRVTQGKINFSNEIFDVRNLAEDAQDNVQSSLRKKRQHFSIERPDEAMYVEADRDRLLQVVCNLLTNASRYTHEEGEIALRILREDDACLIAVVDNGQGITPDLKEAIFDLFVQSDVTLDGKDGGMGVGLTLVRSLTEKMGGEVTVESSGVGCGSTFEVRIPLTDENPVDQFSSGGVESNRKRIPAKTKIVIVEDNADAREMLHNLLVLDGYQVLTASDGKAGLDLILKEIPDVALVDIGLPELDGFQVARRVIQSLGGQQTTKLVALTGYGQEDDHRKIMEAGFDEHLVKPVDGAKLVDVLSE